MRVSWDLRTVLFLFCVSVALGGGAGAKGSDSDPAAPPNDKTPARETDGPLPDLVLLAPGTQIERTVPRGWSHLVLKSIPRLASGDLDTLPGMASSTATLFRTVLLADVRPVGEGAQRRYALRRIGLGLCTPLRGRDTVVLSSTLSAQQADLGLVGRTVLERGEQELRRGRIFARTPTFALFSAPAVMRVGNSHREVLLRYALLVDPATGSLRTLAWAIAADPASRSAAQTMVLVKPGVVYDCSLDVEAQRILGAMPVSWSFAVRGLPPGQSRPLSPDLQPWTIRDAQTPAEARQLEEALRASLSEPAQNQSASR